ncbi:MAG: SIS domain-containing protein [Candidatus Yanofskybacteria bacterium]|nr:SIS domain-containing protein [Candidatus Yanofskybacteria bacterium]
MSKVTTKKSIIASIETKIKLVSDEEFLAELETIGNYMITALKSGNKILTAGNGGSAADAQHFAAELAGKFIYERKGLPAMALTANSSIVTAIGNDFGYENVFSRQIEGFGRQGDVFVGISTSGNSQNLIQACPSANTQHIQEAHIMIIHELCSLIDVVFKN